MDQGQALSDILESVRFLRDHAVSKEDAKAFATKDDLRQVKDDIMAHIDGFTVLHRKLEVELVAVQSNYRRLDDHVEQLAKHLRFQFQDA